MFGHDNYIEAPFQPQPLPNEPIGGARMMTVWISEYVLNTLGYVFQTHDLIQFKLSNKEVSVKWRSPEYILPIIWYIYTVVLTQDVIAFCNRSLVCSYVCLFFIRPMFPFLTVLSPTRSLFRPLIHHFIQFTYSVC